MSISPLDAVGSTPSAGASTSTTSSANSIDSLTPTDFMEMLATQLEDQDPTNPTDPSEILTQTATIDQIESMSNMTGSVENEQASSLIGLAITGTNTAGTSVSGTVTGVEIDASTGTPNLMIGSVAVPLSSVSAIAPASSSTTTSS